jgi:hypothetical protein
MTLTHLRSIVERLLLEGLYGDAVIVQAAWKTLSRWDDFDEAYFMVLNMTEVLILFDSTKAEEMTMVRAVPKGKREDHQVIVAFPTGIPPFWLRVLGSTLCMVPHHSSKWFQNWVGKLPFPQGPKKYSCHSLKNGAVAYLMKLAEERKVDPLRIPWLMKHKSAPTIFMKECSISYANTPEKRLSIARICLTHELTALIPV